MSDLVIEKNRGKRGYRKAIVTVEDAAGEGCQGYQQQVRKGDAQHIAGQRKFHLIIQETRGKDRRQHRRPENGHQRDAQQHQAEGAGHRIDQPLNVRERLIFPVGGQYRHERLGEGAFCKWS